MRGPNQALKTLGVEGEEHKRTGKSKKKEKNRK